MKFRGLEKTSLIEWPKKIVAVAYTGGCNFRCPYCQNSDLVLKPGKIPVVEGREVLDHLESRAKWLDGLAVTGGEPTLCPSLVSFASDVKEKGFDFGLETNGSNPETLNALLERGLVDRVFLDVKAPFQWEKYSKAIGVNNRQLFENVQRSLGLLRGSEIRYECRTTAVPGLLTEADLVEIGEQLRGKTESYYIQQFVPRNTLDPEYEEVEPFNEETLKKVRERIDPYFKVCEIRNL